MSHKLKFPGNAEIISQEKVKAQSNFKCPYCVKKYTSNQSAQHHIEAYHKQTTSGVVDYGNQMFASFEGVEPIYSSTIIMY